MTNLPQQKPDLRSLSCAICGTSFECALQGDCWCSDESMKLPLPTLDSQFSDCLCRSCLNALSGLSSEPWQAKAILLDMDGTLIDSEYVYATSLIRALADYDYPDPEGVTRKLIGIPALESQAILYASYGRDFRMADVTQNYIRYRDELMREGPRLKTGVHELLDAIDAANLPMAIVTASVRSNAQKHLSGAGIIDRFAKIITREDAVNGKPAPDLYLVAAERMALATNDCIAIEDSNPGIASATSAGTRALMVPDLALPDNKARASAAAILPNLHAVRKLLHIKKVL